MVRTTRSTMSDRFSGDIEQELHETLRRNRLKRARAQFIAEFFDDEELEEINRGRGRHSFSRPGGGNSGGRPDYWESTWGRMLRNQASALGEHWRSNLPLFDFAEPFCSRGRCRAGTRRTRLESDQG